MKRVVGLSLMAGVLFACMAVSSGQATPLSTPIKPALATKSSGIVSQVYLRGRYYGGLGVRRYAYRAAWLGYRPYVARRYYAAPYRNWCMF